MSNLLGMKIVHSIDCLLNDSRSVLLSISELVQENSSFGILHQKKYMIIVIKMGIELNDVRVV